jgi:superfamily II DNA or RNA helicase
MAFERKLKLLNQIGEDWGLARIARLNDSELRGLLGPGGNSIQTIREQALRIVKPPTQTVKVSLDDILATAIRLLLRSGIAPKMIKRKSYRRRLAQLVRIGAIYGLKSLVQATDADLKELFGFGRLTERQRDTGLVNFILSNPAKSAVKHKAARQASKPKETTASLKTQRTSLPKAVDHDVQDTVQRSPSSQTSYAWQEEATAAWRKNGMRGVVEAATGSGKTRVGMHIAADLLSSGWQILIITQSRDLVAQWAKEAEDLNISVKTDLAACQLVNGGEPGIGVITYARAGLGELMKGGRQRTKPPRLLIADEAHHLGSQVQGTKILSMPWKALLGLTATLERSDAGVERINEIVGPVVFRYSVKRAVKDGVLAPFHYVTLGVELEQEKWDEYQESDRLVKKWARQLLAESGERTFPKNFMQFAQQKSKAGGFGSFAAGMYITKWNQRKDLVASSQAKMAALKKLHLGTSRSRLLAFSETEQAARSTVAILNEGGSYIARLFSSKSSKTDRTQLLQQFADYEIDGLVAPKLLDEGVNLPEADLGIVLAKSSSSVQLVQRLGRVLRRKGDGRNAVFLTLYARGTYEDPDSHKRNEEKDARIAEVESASIGGRALRLADTAEDFRKLRALLKSTSRA